jgi:phosphatidylglycerophosphate synthase
MEVDALFLLILSTAAAASEVVGPWVVLIGLMRYAFWIAGFAFPWLFQPLPPSYRRKAVCVAEFVLILSALAPILHPIAPALAGTALLLLVWSFGLDIVWAAQRRGSDTAAEAV